MNFLNVILVALIGIGIGALVAYLIAKLNSKKALMQFENDIAVKDAKIEHIQQDVNNLKETIQKLENNIKLLENEKLELNSQLAISETNLLNLEEKLALEKKNLENLQVKFTSDFKLIANSVLKENSKDFAEKNQKEISQLLAPLQEKIKAFEENVDRKYIDETKERISLKQEIIRLAELNNTLNEQANNLTTALRGENKVQGNWGEMILEKILEQSGLVNGKEYSAQFTDVNNSNKRIRPDIVINLPDNKHLIIDSKVSLVAYEKLIAAGNSEEKDIALKAHLLSIKAHIKNLSSKNYQSAQTVNSPDFVLLFMPIEPAFSLAIQNDQDLFNFAWEKKVVIVSPTTLLATLKTITSVWKNEKQTKNAQEIAKKAGDLYDKFVNFTEDLKKVDKGLSSAQSAYNDAFNKLKSGRGNLISRIENLKILGAKNNKDFSNITIENQDERSL